MEGKEEEHNEHHVEDSKGEREEGSSSAEYEAYFPRELIEHHILVGLPPKALFRFQCVDKQSESFIKALLNDPKFLSQHTQNAFTSSPHSLIFGSFDFHPGDPFLPFKEKLSVLSVTSADDRRRRTAEARDLPPVFDGFASFFQILHCDGVLCVVGNTWKILLWNPELGEVKLVRPDLSRLFRSRWGIPIVGFGRDSVADDYKVVVGQTDYSYPPLRAGVYSLGSDAWRPVAMPIPISSESVQIGDLYHGGFHYWLLRSCKGLEMASFDFHREFFAVVGNLPAEIRNSMWSFKLVQWNGGVALVSYPGESVTSAKTVEIWAMDRGGGGAWSRVFTIGPFPGLLRPVVFWKASELLMEEVDGGLVLYNVNDKKLRAIDVVSGGERLSYLACVYVPTLVSVFKRPRAAVK